MPDLIDGCSTASFSGLDWIRWVSQGDTEHLTVANKLEMRMYLRKKGIRHKVVNAKSELH